MGDEGGPYDQRKQLLKTLVGQEGVLGGCLVYVSGREVGIRVERREGGG